MLVVHVVILGNLGQFNHCTNSKWQIDNQNVIFGFIQTRGTIHEYSLSFEEAFKDLATFKIIFRYKKTSKSILNNFDLFQTISDRSLSRSSKK